MNVCNPQLEALFVCLSVCLFVYLFIRFVYLFICSVCLFVYLFICLFIQHEELRVASLESKLTELSKSVGNYDQQREADQLAIQ